MKKFSAGYSAVVASLSLGSIHWVEWRFAAFLREKNFTTFPAHFGYSCDALTFGALEAMIGFLDLVPCRRGQWHGRRSPNESQKKKKEKKLFQKATSRCPSRALVPLISQRCIHRHREETLLCPLILPGFPYITSSNSLSSVCRRLPCLLIF